MRAFDRLPRCRRAVTATFLLVASLFATSQAIAASLQVAPTTLTLQARQNADGLWLSNSGSEPVTVQVRVFHWTQSGGVESLAPATDLVASPPMQTLPPGQKQLVRIVRPTPAPPAAELAYRVIVDELPQRKDKPGLQFVLRYSIPVFVDPPTIAGKPLAPSLSARLVTDAKGGAVLEITNTGTMHAQLADLEFQAPTTAVPRTLLAGLVGYVLPGQAMRWPLKESAAKLTGGVLRARINSAPDKTQLAPAKTN